MLSLLALLVSVGLTPQPSTIWTSSALFVQDSSRGSLWAISTGGFASHVSKSDLVCKGECHLLSVCLSEDRQASLAKCICPHPLRECLSVVSRTGRRNSWSIGPEEAAFWIAGTDALVTGQASKVVDPFSGKQVPTPRNIKSNMLTELSSSDEARKVVSKASPSFVVSQGFRADRKGTVRVVDVGSGSGTVISSGTIIGSLLRSFDQRFVSFYCDGKLMCYDANTNLTKVAGHPMLTTWSWLPSTAVLAFAVKSDDDKSTKICLFDAISGDNLEIPCPAGYVWGVSGLSPNALVILWSSKVGGPMKLRAYELGAKHWRDIPLELGTKSYLVPVEGL